MSNIECECRGYEDLVCEYNALCAELNCDCPFINETECDYVLFGYKGLEERIAKMEEYLEKKGYENG